MKKIIVLIIITAVLLNSCSQAQPYWYNPFYEMRLDGDRNSKTGVEHETPVKILQDILSRPVNKSVLYKGITLLIPEGTKINDKKNRYEDNLVDEKTGHGLQIYFSYSDTRDSCEGRYCKRKNGRIYYIRNNDITTGTLFSDYTEQIRMKIVKVNGFVKETK